jgi:hypothetical protein
MRFFSLIAAFVIPVLAQQTGQFSSYQNCTACHTNLVLPSGAVDVSNLDNPPRIRGASRPPATPLGPASLWPASIMAHSARDPYHRAKVRFEGATNPTLTAVIEDTCLRCHAPLQQYPMRSTGTLMKLDDLNAIGREGVNCTLCHQTMTQSLGTKDSFEGGFTINNSRLIYGPHSNPFAQPMLGNTGYMPVLGDHIRNSAMCATCHTVITPVLTASGEIAGEFIEQSPFLEWLASDWSARGRSCQSCHVPTLKDTAGREVAQYIAHQPNGRAPYPPTSPRTPFGLHSLTGGNYQVLGMLGELFPAELPWLDAQRGRSRENLQDAVDLLAGAKREGDSLTLTVKLTNLTGHKLPTGFPSRRIWLSVSAIARDGQVLFRSGRWDGRSGHIEGAGEPQPHYSRITRQDQAMIYETEMEDVSGNLTSSILRTARYRKDNRILPAGFDLARVQIEGIHSSELSPAGTGGDADFRPGSDTVEYSFAAPNSKGPYRILVEVLYQSIKPSHVSGMDAGRSADEKTFLDLYARHRSPVTMARRELITE